jgi:transcriptional regulator GlxA family with amidase domain
MDDIKSVGFLLYNGVEELDFVGPWEMITMWGDYAAGPTRVDTVAENANPLRCAKGLTVVPDVSFADAPQYDILFVAGGHAAFDAAADPQIVDFVTRQASTAQHVASICTGTFILHAAGLLEGRTAVSHWKAAAQLDALPGTTSGTGRYVRDGNIWTSAGVSAGIDLALAMIAAIAGEAAAACVQQNAEYFPDGRVYSQRHDIQKDDR